MVKLRIYLGDYGSDFIEVPITEEQKRKLLNAKRIGVDDNGVLFMEQILQYLKEVTA